MNPADRYKTISRGIGRDMSPAAIERRLEIVSELRAFTMFLGTAKKTPKSAVRKKP